MMLKAEIRQLMQSLQDKICQGLEQLDGVSTSALNAWGMGKKEVEGDRALRVLSLSKPEGAASPKVYHLPPTLNSGTTLGRRT